MPVKGGEIILSTGVATRVIILVPEEGRVLLFLEVI